MIPPERERIEELAEEIWALTERGECTLARLLDGSKIERPASALAAMVAGGLAESRDGRVSLLPRGVELARAVVRRHRLAEMLFMQVLEIGEPETEAAACQIEHILSGEVTDSVCSFLGHPPHCPHGKEIPRGRCCETSAKEVRPLVTRLADLAAGDSARVVFMTPRSRSSLDRIATLGVVPGAMIRLTQKSPAVVLAVGETLVAVDREIADEIFVRRSAGGGAR
ncbi:MAG: metal-dependent transcriptional regulator [Acidobacteria bacterium]|nr:metal-dependent transcriptional regulator [Acidobacteriota bacterium]